MKIEEIITNPSRDEHIDWHKPEFDGATPLANINGLQLRKVVSNEDVKYGLFDSIDRLVGYFHLEKYLDMWVVRLVQLAQIFKGMGYGTFLYDYAVMNDKLKVLSDATNSGGIHGSRTLWTSLYNKRRYQIVGYDMQTDTQLPNITPTEVYNERDNIRWLALPTSHSINERLEYIKSVCSPQLSVVWYGPGTTTEDYFNY
jgi:hypothetical protein